ncbi:MAG: FG-GAP-like repeat-containing protein, partial [Acidimicrobiales bacterium]
MRSRWSLGKGVALGVAVVASILIPASPAMANVGVFTSLILTTAAAVGEDISGSVTIFNTNSAPHQAESNNLTQVRLTPSCGSSGSAANPCPTPDAGVFSVISATGAAGTACAGVNFTAGAPDASGGIVLTPSVPVALAPPGGPAGSDRCTINFTLRAVRVPSIDSNPGSPGVQTWASVRGQGTSTPSNLTVAGFSSVEITVFRGTPTLTTQVTSPTVPLGGTISDTATLTFPAGAAAPTGTVTFSVFGPNNPACTAAPIFQSTNPVVGGAATTRTATSGSFPVAQPGVYRFTATYSGDANYNTVTSPCNAPNELVTVLASAERAVADFDGDGKTDLSVFRPPSGTWFIAKSTGGSIVGPFGVNGDIPVPADYDGDGLTDLAVFRPATGTWFIAKSTGGSIVGPFGVNGDIPVPADYDGDAKADLAVFRPATGTWFIAKSTGGSIVGPFGVNGDIPVPGDYDGDAKADLAVFRPATGTWFIAKSTGGSIVGPFG